LFRPPNVSQAILKRAATKYQTFLSFQLASPLKALAIYSSYAIWWRSIIRIVCLSLSAPIIVSIGNLKAAIFSPKRRKTIEYYDDSL
jgi:hypothetical protein